MTPTKAEEMAARLESGWCPIESHKDMEQAAAELRRLSALCAELEAERDNLKADLANAVDARSFMFAACREAQEIAAAAQAERDALRAELESEKQWGRLWYFVSDEAPLAFEKIVCEHTPSRWIQEAHKLRAAMKGTT